MSSPDWLALLLHGHPVGILTRGPVRRQVRLTWDTGFMPGPVPLSESFGALPGTEPATDAVSNWLGGYAPEGNQRTALAEARDVRPDDLFALLREYGGSIAGAVTLCPPEETPGWTPRYDLVGPSIVGRRLRQAVARHDLASHDDSRSMLPGFQPKLLLARFGSRWYEPHGRAHSTHLVKPRLESRPHAVYDEWYAHQLARRVGLASYDAQVMRFGNQTALVVERFDRMVADDEVALIHQEDLAQALSLTWLDADAKFQDPKRPHRADRPSAGRVAELLGSLPGSEQLLVAWLQHLTFHVLIGDNDAHAKNTGLLHEPGGTRLTDVYDAVPNLYQPDRITYDLALAFDGVFDHRRISVGRIVAEASSWRVLPETTIQATVTDMVDRFGAALEPSPPRGTTPGLKKRLNAIAERLAAGHEIGPP